MAETTNQPDVRSPRCKVGRLGQFMLWLFVAFIGLGILALVGLRFFADELADNQWPYLESGVLNVLTYLLIILSILGALLWILLFSGRRWYTRLGWCLVIVGVAALPLIAFEPIFGGGLAVRGLRPRFWQVAPVIEQASGIADLIPESSADFPQFFGPHRNGIVDSLMLEENWQQKPPQRLWKKPIGAGWSGFATRNGFAVTMQQDGPRECVSCYRVADGILVWNYCIAKRHEELLGGVGPRSTPTIHQGRVFALGAVGNLCCLNGATGEPIWRRDLLQLANIATVERKNGRGELVTIEQSSVTWGRAASPLMYQSLVIVPFSAEHTLAAFDQETGEVVWMGGSQPPSYSSPVLATIGGETQIVILNESSVSGHDPKTGVELWIHPRPGSSSGDANTSLATVVGDDQILVTKGYGMGGELLRISRRENATFAVTSIWSSSRVLKTKLTNAVIRDGYAYAISSEVLECVDLANGDRRWRAPLRFGHGQMLIVGKHLLAHTEDGFLVLAEANPEAYRELGRIKSIEGVCWNTIAFFGDRVLVRSNSEAACFRLSTINKANADSAASAVIQSGTRLESDSPALAEPVAHGKSRPSCVPLALPMLF